MRDENSKKKDFTVVDRRFWVDDNKELELETDGEVSPSKPSYVRELEQLIEEKDKRLQEYINQQKELLNEFESSKERIRRDVKNEVKRTRRSMLIEFLDVLDNLDRALETIDQSEISSIIQGVTLVRDLFIGKLSAWDVHGIEALGQCFDPSKHEAISVVPVDDLAMDGQVMGVVRQGYTIGDDILRPAQVAVARRGGK
ncbi:MAG: nucleotide exchange factor GrpE [Proteobacteria bacterium]|nr:nucleotide exchange factor GrpE [Pseudomonadota bacterium]